MMKSLHIHAIIALLSLCLLVRLVGAKECAASGPGQCANPDVDVDAVFVAENERDEACPSRPFIVKCAGQYLDTNQNGLLERSELQSAIDALPWYSRGIISMLGSVDKMMKKCDLDGDGAISMDYDMKNNGETCLATCFKRLAFKKAFFPECTPEALQ